LKANRIVLIAHHRSQHCTQLSVGLLQFSAVSLDISDIIVHVHVFGEKTRVTYKNVSSTDEKTFPKKYKKR